MNMFGFSDNQWPGDAHYLKIFDVSKSHIDRSLAYASMINFELYQDDYGDYYVRTLHNGVEVNIPACGSNIYCPWTTFK